MTRCCLPRTAVPAEQTWLRRPCRCRCRCRRRRWFSSSSSLSSQCVSAWRCWRAGRLWLAATGWTWRRDTALWQAHAVQQLPFMPCCDVAAGQTYKPTVSHGHGQVVSSAEGGCPAARVDVVIVGRVAPKPFSQCVPSRMLHACELALWRLVAAGGCWPSRPHVLQRAQAA